MDLIDVLQRSLLFAARLSSTKSPAQRGRHRATRAASLFRLRFSGH
jgi:hypothetical protein